MQAPHKAPFGGMRGRFRDEVRFFRNWICAPVTTGAMVPSSSATARRMAAFADPASALPVLELGPGTGSITRAILARGVAPERIVAVEYSPLFHARLAADFPRIHLLQGNALDLDEALGARFGSGIFSAAFSSLPLLNFKPEQRTGFVEAVLSRLAPGAPLVQFTYGLTAPVPAKAGSFSAQRSDFVLLNFPPAHIWVYRRLPLPPERGFN